MSFCPLCNGPMSQSSVALDNALSQNEEQQNTIARLENQVVISFLVALVVGFIAGAGLIIGVRQLKEPEHGPAIRQEAPEYGTYSRRPAA